MPFLLSVFRGIVEADMFAELFCLRNAEGDKENINNVEEISMTM